jgi:aspartate 4-decarboxylase
MIWVNAGGPGMWDFSFRQGRWPALDRAELDGLSRLSPFELKDRLIALASSHGERVMLNAGRGNPNFLATAPRRGFFALGPFAMAEAERVAGDLPEGLAGIPSADGIAARFADYLDTRQDQPGTAFLNSALSYARERLSLCADVFVHELVQGALGCTYPEPVRMLPCTEAIVGRYLAAELAHGTAPPLDLFAVEGASAGITYAFTTLRTNGLIQAGDHIALGMPIFTPYIEIPRLDDYRLVEVAVAADPESGWQYPERELDRLRDPRVKAFLLVNPGNPTSVKIDRKGLERIAHIVRTARPDLIIVTDDVYATMADDFSSLFALCPANTILVYSFSKYFGVTGWRLGVVAIAANNMLDRWIAALPENERRRLDARYGSLAVEPRKLKFIDRVVGDSRAVALNHTAGLSTPQQVQLALFALYGLMDECGKYKRAIKRLLRRRHDALRQGLGSGISEDPNATNYYTILDIERLGRERYGDAFVGWLLGSKNPLELLLRLADEAGVVLLPGKGFGTPHPSARISMANLNEADYARIGEVIRKLLDEYAAEYRSAPSAADGRLHYA